ncbi:MAG: MBL fold metallo-hydrolase [Lachnospiraceae bacterium]|nr:MBL fold metallo-hydrolase [Lachnospiraceae bacterium]
MKITELRYSNTNTYVIESEQGKILFDTGWAGSFPAFCHAMGEAGISVPSLSAILLSHFHPDHMGIAQEIADRGPVILVPDVQLPFLHASDSIFEKEKNAAFRPITDEKVRSFPLTKSREVLGSYGIDGVILHTPGHSDDSISLCLSDGSIFVGDLNPLYELELHRGTQIGESWERLLALQPKTVYYGHAKTAVLSEPSAAKPVMEKETTPPSDDDLYKLVSTIMKLIDRNCTLAKIQKKTGADAGFIEDVTRMYLTHRNIGVRGILDRIEIKGR